MNPQEQSHPPDRPIIIFQITASRQKVTHGKPDTWYVTCPQWNYSNESNEAIDIHIGRIVNEIKNHNENS